MVSFILPIEGTQDKYLISLGREIAVVTWDGISEKVANIEKLGEVDNAEGFEENRINDGKADPYGRLWAGNFSEEIVYERTNKFLMCNIDLQYFIHKINRHNGT